MVKSCIWPLNLLLDGIDLESDIINYETKYKLKKEINVCGMYIFPKEKKRIWFQETF